MISKENFIKFKKDLKLINDKQRIKLLELANDDFSRFYIIKSFDDENLKIKYLDTILRNSFKTIIIKSLSNDDIKMKYIDNLLEQDFKNIKDLIRVIISLKTDENKIKYIDKIKEYFNKKEISKDKFMFFFDDLLSYKTQIIVNLSSENKRMMYVKEAVDASSNEEIVGLYDKELHEERLKNTLIREAKEKGIEEGIEQGYSSGRNEGMLEEKKIVAKNMLNKGMDKDLICEITGLTNEEIEKLE